MNNSELSTNSHSKLEWLFSYFGLQLKMINRHIKALGVPPILAYLLAPVLFIGGIGYIASKSEYTPYLIILAALALLLKLSEKHRTDFLNLTFKKYQFRIIRIVENLLVATPFIVALVLLNQDLFSIALAVLSVLISANGNLYAQNFAIPTPYAKNPFEFLVGFRKSFFIYPIAYALLILSFLVDNYNLGVFSFILLFIIGLGYYTYPENEYYVWVNNLSPQQFLLKKIKTATLHISFLTIPVLIALAFFDPSKIWMLPLFFIIGVAFLIVVILAKYSAYPSEMMISEAVILGVTAMFPPLIFAAAPYFYSKSVKHLSHYLS